MIKKKFINIIILFLIFLIFFIITNFNFLFYNLSLLQEEIIKKISFYTENNFSLLPLIILLLTFIYGIIHSCGPGHGKILLMTLAIKEKLSYKKILLYTFLIAYLQGFTAYFIVIFFINLTNKIAMSFFYDFDSYTRIFSSILIIVIGVFNLYTHSKEKHDNCEINIENKNLLLFTLSLALTPCPGVMSMLLFLKSFNFDKYLLFYTFSTSSGIFILISFFTILSRKFEKILIDNKNKKIYFYINIFSSLLLIIFGILQIIILY